MVSVNRDWGNIILCVSYKAGSCRGIVYIYNCMYSAGYTAALCCAANSRVAECLAMILSQMIPQSPDDSLKSSSHTDISLGEPAPPLCHAARNAARCVTCTGRLCVRNGGVSIDGFGWRCVGLTVLVEGVRIDSFGWRCADWRCRLMACGLTVSVDGVWIGGFSWRHVDWQFQWIDSVFCDSYWQAFIDNDRQMRVWNCRTRRCRLYWQFIDWHVYERTW